MSFVKELRSEIKGCNLKCKIRHIKLHLRWAWQRFWMGYDERDVMEFGPYLNKKIVLLLEDMLNKDILPMRIPPEIVKKTDTILYYTLDQTKVIIDTMLHYFKMADEDYVYAMRLGKKDVYVLDIEEYKKLESIRKQNQDLAYEHLRMFIDEIWY